MKITMPSWHEDARRMRDQGMRLAQIVKLLEEAGIKVSESRVSQVTSPNWQNYMDRDRARFMASRKELSAARKEGRLPDLKSVMQKADQQLKEQQVSDRGFEIVTSPDPTDVNHRVRITCSQKGCKNSMIFSRRGTINPVHAAKWFRDKGWFVAGHPRSDLCEEHYKGITQSEEQPVVEPVTEQVNDRADGGANIVTENIIVSEPVAPKEPSRMDKRIIHTKLEEVYVDEFIGYRTEWNDDKVASNLGVPKEWVVMVRDDSFGPEVTQGKIMEGLIQLGGYIEEHVATIRTKVDALNEWVEKYDTLSEELNKRLDEYDRHRASLDVSLQEFNSKMKELKGDDQ